MKDYDSPEIVELGDASVLTLGDLGDPDDSCCCSREGGGADMILV